MTEESREIRDQFRQLVMGVTDYAVYLLDPQGFVTSWNAGAERIKGYKNDEIIGQHFSRFYTPDDSAQGKPDLELESALAQGKAKDEGWRVRKDGSRFWANVLTTALYDDAGHLYGYSKVIRDVTERRRIDEPLRSLVNHVVDGIITIDEHGTVQSFNPAAERIFAYSASEVIGQNVKVLMPEPYHGEHDRYIGSYVRTGRAKIIGGGREVVGRRKDGATFPMELAVSTFCLDDRRLFTGIVRDITRRTQMEQELRKRIQELAEAEERMRSVVNHVVDGIITIDEHGAVQSFNPAAERIFGFSASEVIGQNVKVLMPEPFHGEHDEYIANYVRTGQAKIIGSGREVVGRRKDGSTFPMDLAISVFRLGQARYFTGIVRDITERKRAEERFRLAVEAAPNGMLIVGNDGEITLANVLVEKLFGYTAQELIGQPVELLVPERFRAGHPNYRTDYLANPQTRGMGLGRELFGLRRDGSEFPVEIGLQPMQMEGGLFVLASIIDVSERKRAEAELRQAHVELEQKVQDRTAELIQVNSRLKKSVEEKEVLLREIHHRVKNNLQVISSLLDLQSQHIHDPQSVEMFRESRQRVRSMALVHERLYRSQDLAQVDFTGYVEGLVNYLFSSYRVDTNRISLDVAAQEVRLSIDAAIPCGLIINELVSNCLKHAFQGREQGSIRIELFPVNEGDVLLSVCDNGVEFPKELDVQIAESFGLQLVRDLVDQLHGTIQAERSDGTTIRIIFPMSK